MLNAIFGLIASKATLLSELNIINRACSEFSDSALLVIEKCSFTLSKLRFFNSSRLDSENSEQALNKISFLMPLLGLKSIYIRIVTLYLLLFYSLLANAQEAFVPPELHVVWEKAASRQDAEAIKAGAEKVWTKSCINLAKGLIVGQAAWGMGIFKSAACFVDNKKVGGKEKKSPWVLKYNEGNEFVTLKLYNSAAKDATLMAQVQYASSEWATYYFYDEGFGDLIGLRILNELPIMGFLKRGSLTKSLEIRTRSIHVPPTGVRLYKTLLPPEKLQVFDSLKVEGLILPRVKGFGSKLKFEDPELLVDAENSEPAEMNRPKKSKGSKNSIFGLTWKFNDTAQSANKEAMLALQDERGAGLLIADLDKSINEAVIALDEASQEGLLKKFLKGVKSSFASGYVGVRYGVQVLSGDPLLKKTSLFGVVAEVPLGPIEGVRYYYDLVSKRKNQTDGIETHFGYSRHILGKALSVKFSRFIDRLELTPKVGMWTFDAKLIDSYNEDGTAATAGSFSIKKGLSFSLELGIEWLSQNYTIRPWYSYDYANALNKVTSKKVTANRLGIDAYFRAGPSFRFIGANMRTAFIGFFMFESIGLSTTSNAPVVEDDERQIVEVSFTSGYAGSGIALSW